MKCRGYILHTLILKLYDSIESGQDAEHAARALTAEDMRLLADYGQKARETCWSKGFVMTVARKLADLAAIEDAPADLRIAVERMIVRMDGLFSRLPNGVQLDLADLSLEVYNHASLMLAERKAKIFLPANIVGNACCAVSRRKEEEAARLAGAL
ncbi:MAG: hypothetical protein K2Q10_03410 [Rhodospirillales bacterium]|nr:hypothetical protein [Rhodospirillales bacterium]